MPSRKSLAFLASALAFSPLLASATLKSDRAPKQAIALVSQNLAKGTDNFFTYVRFADLRLTIKKGDVFTYRIFLDPQNPMAKGGVDIDVSGLQGFRDLHVPDQNGIDSHGDGILTPAIGKWYTRLIPMDAAAGRRTNSFELVFEGDKFGTYTQFISDVAILHADGTKTVVFPAAQEPLATTEGTNGYTTRPDFATVPEADVTSRSMDSLIAEVHQQAIRTQQLEDARSALTLAQRLNALRPNPADTAAISKAQTTLQEAIRARNSDEKTFQTAASNFRAALVGVNHLLKGYTADLIGHAHIDVQWLWESAESLQSAHDTWNQATKFMAEFPDFKFTQSSAGYYREVEYTWPDLFKAIQKYVRNGQWEVVGGRECEADENLLSPEDHARQFLYAQRYFRDKFGKAAVVGWEPDTFGHTAQMPQILQLGGCKYYYFCRGGKGLPLFNWVALDGTKVLAYDEVAAGAWYNTPLTNENLSELPPYVAKTGRKEMMWVYGVGNHGGGPTREHIETANAWKKATAMPTTQFSTAEAFFERQAKSTASQLPDVKSDLEGVFQGCYTTNATMKRLNRQAESATAAAEAVASVANIIGGFPYPGADFAKNWQKITFNQHHDTICGSSFHFAYLQTFPDLKAVLASDHDIQRDAMVNLSVKVKTVAGGENFLAFNPTGWARDGWVDCRLPSHLLGGGPEPEFKNPVAVGPDGVEIPIDVTNTVTREARFYAKAVPAFGYRVYVVRDGTTGFAPLISTGNTSTVENAALRVTFDLKNGSIKSLIDKATGQEFAGAAGLGRLEAHMEKPIADAWTIAPILSVAKFVPNSYRPITGPGYQGAAFFYHVPGQANSTFRQEFRLYEGQAKVDVSLVADWHVVANRTDPSPLVRLAFDVAAPNPTATYEVPFGAVTRPTDGAEGPAQAWADVSGEAGGVTIIEDSKHGFSATGATLRMSVIRSCLEPDMLPNDDLQPMAYSILPHTGTWQSADATRQAVELETPLMSMQVPPDANGPAPREYSFASSVDPSVVATCLKQSEDGKGWVIRVFESNGAASKASIRLATQPAWVKTVNFLEDVVGKPPVSAAGGLQLDLRPWEIRTVEIGYR